MNSNEEKFLTHIVETYSDTILRIAFQYTKNIYDSQDIAQDVFLSLINKSLDRLNAERLKAYIIRATINKCHSYHRRRTRREVISLEDVPPVFTRDEENILDEVRALPERYRVVIFLYYYEGYSVKEIADILGTNPNTVSSRLRRARAKLKTFLTEDSYE